MGSEMCIRDSRQAPPNAFAPSNLRSEGENSRTTNRRTPASPGSNGPDTPIRDHPDAATRRNSGRAHRYDGLHLYALWLSTFTSGLGLVQGPGGQFARVKLCGINGDDGQAPAPKAHQTILIFRLHSARALISLIWIWTGHHTNAMTGLHAAARLVHAAMHCIQLYTVSRKQGLRNAQCTSDVCFYHVLFLE